MQEIELLKELIKSYNEEEVDNVTKQYKRGLITNEERYLSTIKIWEKVTDDVTEAMKDNFDELNPIYMMAQSRSKTET